MGIGRLTTKRKDTANVFTEQLGHEHNGPSETNWIKRLQYDVSADGISEADWTRLCVRRVAQMQVEVRVVYGCDKG